MLQGPAEKPQGGAPRLAEFLLAVWQPLGEVA